MPGHCGLWAWGGEGEGKRSLELEGGRKAGFSTVYAVCEWNGKGEVLIFLQQSGVRGMEDGMSKVLGN